MRDVKNLVGLRFGMLVVLSRIDHDSPLTRWLCVCDCGVEHKVNGASLTRKVRATRSCGCLTAEARRKGTHGMSKTKEYKLLASMCERCHNPKHKRFADWGGRGITVHEAWRENPALFVQYVRDVLGEKPAGLSLDRIDNDKSYEPGNLRWADNSDQTRNSRHARVISFNGVSKHLVDWARDIGIGMAALSRRLEKWSLERALTEPPNKTL